MTNIKYWEIPGKLPPVAAEQTELFLGVRNHHMLYVNSTSLSPFLSSGILFHLPHISKCCEGRPQQYFFNTVLLVLNKLKICNVVWHYIQGFKFLLNGFKNKKKQGGKLPLLYILLTLISSSVYIRSWGISHWALLPWKPLKLMGVPSSWTAFFPHSKCKDKFCYCNCNGSIGAHYYKPSRIHHRLFFTKEKKLACREIH